MLSLDEGSCDDDLPGQAPKSMKFINTTVVPSLAVDGVDDEARTPQFLRWTNVGVLEW